MDKDEIVNELYEALKFAVETLKSQHVVNMWDQDYEAIEKGENAIENFETSNQINDYLKKPCDELFNKK